MNKQLAALALLALLVTGCDSLPSWMGGSKEEKVKLPGTRIAVLPANADLQPDAELKELPVALPPALANGDWPQHGGNLAASGNFDKSNSASVGDGESFSHVLIPHPVVAGGMVFAMDSVGYISAHDAADIGNVRWKVKALSIKHEPDVMGGGLAYDNGKLYATSGRGAVAALDAATGTTLWRKELHIPFRSAPAIAGDKLFAITIDNQLFALNTANGEVAWSQRGIGETAGLMNSVSPLVAGDAVIVPYSSGEIYALSAADGKEIWSESLSAGKRTQASAVFSGIGGDPVTDGQVLFAVSAGGTLSTFALANGQHIWDRPIGSINTPWLAGDYLFVLTSDQVLVCMVKFSGKVRWSTQLTAFEDMDNKRSPITWRGPVMVGGRLAVVSSNGQLMLVSAADGKTLATQSIADDVYTPPAVAGGRMYLVTQGAKLYSLQ